MDTSKHEISSRDERENQPPAQGSAVWQEQIGLISGGEFGNTLGMVMTDTLQGGVTWSRWERTSAGQAAVFRYSVPRSASHFEVIGSRERADLVGFGSVSRGSARSRVGVQPGDPANATVVRARPGYHGTFALDPATGTIFRITMEAEAKDGAPFKQAGILVEYGPVQVGGSEFICPIRSLALSAALPDPNTASDDAPTQWLNETLFSEYHRFGSTARILESAADTQPTKPEAATGEPQPASPQPDQTPSVAEATAVQADTAPASIPPNPPAEPAPAVSTPAASAPPASAPAPPPAKEPEIAVRTTIELNVNRVLIPVVVRDKASRSVSGLMKEDFQVFDNDKPRPIAAFTVQTRETAQANSGSHTDNIDTVSAGSAAPSSTTPSRFTAFLFDGMHLAFEDLAYARTTAIKAPDSALTGTDMAVILSTSGKVNSGLTRDRAKLQDAIVSVQPRGISQHSAAACPRLDYYQADLIENRQSETAIRDAVAQVMVCNPGMPQSEAENIAEAAARVVLADNRQDVLNTYATLAEFVRRIADFPGQRTLILVSSGFVTNDPDTLAAQSRLIDLAAQRNLTIGALDARGVYSAEITASDDLQGRNPQAITEFRRGAGLLAGGSLEAIADGTGGTFFHNSNDLDAGLKALVEAPEIVYLLELSLGDEKPDGKYHRLKVRVNREGVQLRTRPGYASPRAEKKRK